MNVPCTIRAMDKAVPTAPGAAERFTRRTPPTAAKLLLPVWGYRPVRRFLDVGLHTFLAPGNIPASVGMLPCRFVILTREEDEAYFLSDPTFRELTKVCPTEIRFID